ncbi:DUF2239 family protein [Phenylobacterium sp.]|uniref:DUF2239 family protein n=1 Tax=Phenylobacterium sp. TaxID=1871053 RepID=UPI00356196A5
MEFAVFLAGRLLARGDLATAARAAYEGPAGALVVIDGSTGRSVDLDLRGSVPDVLARLRSTPAPKASRGRPKLGVVAREVTLLPRHWDWLAIQPSGASAALRRLVDQARRATDDAGAVREAQEVTYRVMTTLAGDLPGYEEATRALFASDRARFEGLIAAWPQDVGAYVGELSERVWPPSP